jgi:chromate transporter
MTWLALQGFGGVFPVARRVLVEQRKWFTEQEFLEDWAVAQVAPGPNVVNLSVMLGAKTFGPLGSFVAVLGLLLFPSFVLILAAIFLHQFRDLSVVHHALHGMGAVSAGLIAGSSLKMASALKTHPLSFPIAALIILITFVLLAFLNFPLIFVLVFMGTISVVLTYIRIREKPTGSVK